MRYVESFQVRFFETDRAARSTPVALFNYFQEAAIAHGDAVGMDGAHLAALGYIWMMNRLRLDVYRYPRRGETVRVETWGSNFQGLYAVREWRATDADGQAIAAATGRWIILESARKKIVRIPALVPEAYGEEPDRAIDDPFDRMHAPENESGTERRFHVRLSELDTNQHANSACYVDWCLESVPLDLMETHMPARLEITYKRESKLGDGLIARGVEREAHGDERRFHHGLWREDDGALAAIARSVWRTDR